MKKVNNQDIAEVERQSPKGKFHIFRKGISEALGREPDSLDLLKQHPFDVTLVRIPPGAALCPYHSHLTQWEMYMVVSGRAQVRDESGITDVVAGDAFMFAPSEAHQLTNHGQEDFVYYVIADNPIADACHYPDSNKWGIYGMTGDGVLIRGSEAGYFDGEE